MKKIIHLLFLLSVCSTASFSQAPVKIIHYPFGQQDSPFYPNARWVIADNNRRIWVSGSDSTGHSGFATYDGISWTDYFTPNLMHAGTIWDFDSNNRAWATTVDSLIIFDGVTWQQISKAAFGVPGSVMNLVVGTNDEVWITSQVNLGHQVLTQWNGINSITYDTSTFGGNITGCWTDNSDSVYVVSKDNIWKFNGYTWNHLIDSLPNTIAFDYIVSLTFDHDNNLWVLGNYNYSSGNEYGIYKFINSELQLYSLTNHNLGAVYTIKTDLLDIPWVQSSEGITQAIPDTVVWLNPGIICYPYETIAFDSLGNLWLSGVTCEGEIGEYLLNYSSGIEVQPVTQSDISIFPNPATDMVNIKTGSPEKFDVEITDILGEIIYRKKDISGQCQINVNQWQQGIFSVNITRKRNSRIVSESFRIAHQ